MNGTVLARRRMQCSLGIRGLIAGRYAQVILVCVTGHPLPVGGNLDLTDERLLFGAHVHHPCAPPLGVGGLARVRYLPQAQAVFCTFFPIVGDLTTVARTLTVKGAYKCVITITFLGIECLPDRKDGDLLFLAPQLGAGLQAHVSAIASIKPKLLGSEIVTLPCGGFVDGEKCVQVVKALLFAVPISRLRRPLMLYGNHSAGGNVGHAGSPVFWA